MERKTRQAVSIILKFKDQIYLIRRQNHLRAFPGYTSFPGGKVDRMDFSSNFEETLRNTAIREIEEELGLNISNQLPISPYGKATSPEFNPIRFETYFFLVELNEFPVLVEDAQEIAESWWIKPEDILSEFNFGKHLMVLPVREIIKTLVANKNYSMETILDLNNRVARVPCIEPIKDFLQYMPLSNTVPPAERTNCFIIGDTNKVLIDPSPKNLEEYQVFLSEVRRYNLTKIIISHHHKDHHQYSTNLARDLELPIYISQDSFNRISQKYGNTYFLDIKVIFLKEGDVLGDWLENKILAYSIPGHDEGHFGFAPESLSWFIVGDLFQGVGTVVVGGEEGDMGKYMASLQKVIKLKPKCVIPSHGIALGGTNILEKTFEHRLLREHQVEELMKKGKCVDDILKIIYFDLPSKLIPYARANINSHILWLEKQRKLLKD